MGRKIKNRASRLDDRVSKMVGSAVEAAVNHRFQVSQKLLRDIDVSALREQRRLLWKCYGRIDNKNRRSPNEVDDELVDLEAERVTGYNCIYCGKLTIDLRVLIALSHAFQLVIPYVPRGWSCSHILYWTHSASLEHHRPRRWKAKKAPISKSAAGSAIS